ncbi:hypothetical protein PRK78_005328 [Emydomyces testavorans]|uniref:DUF7357 domain-containing protein n=1 Tax=Emydomyces testavorans TaxID=2070801 RepID=A0AAF0IKI5_9EURO|nr:hypothetical protein PRK78_005328 [Emydomyces testavorans]
MRLHLVIQRHDLPVVRILWTIPSCTPRLSNQPSAASSFTGRGTQTLTTGSRSSAGTSFNTALTSFSTVGGCTIAQLLADVNEVIPLETQPTQSEDQNDGGPWALEDYVAELMGSECLHFMRVETLLRDGDELVQEELAVEDVTDYILCRFSIRPLHYEELAARQITGRHQIAVDGTHLIDGVAFGKGYLKRDVSSRPAVNIPPRNKRRRIGEEGWDRDRSVIRDLVPTVSPPRPEETECGPRNTNPSSAELEQDEDGDDKQSQALMTTSYTQVETQPIEQASPSGADNTAIVSVVDMPGQIATVLGREAKSPQQAEGTNKLLTDRHEKSILASSSSAPSESESDISSDSKGPSEHDSDSDLLSSDSSTGVSSSLSSSLSSDGSSSVSDADVSVNKTPKSLLEKGTHGAKSILQPIVNPPGAGSRRTKHSNIRTKMRRRLTKLKAAGVLHENANFNDLRVWEQAGVWKNEPKKSERVVEETEISSHEKVELAKRRAQLLRDIETDGEDVTPGSMERDCEVLQAASSIGSQIKPVAEAPLPKKGAKLDLTSTRRLLFGSLGLRTTKIKSNAERVKTQLAEKLKKFEPKTKEGESKERFGPAEKIQALVPVENWQDFIILKATECIYEDVEIPSPPFPFVQRWDAESQKQIRERRNHQNFQCRKRKRKSRAHVYNTNSEHYGNGGGFNTEITLNYSDEECNAERIYPVDVEDATEREENAQQVAAERIVESTPTQSEADLPLLENISSLLVLTEDHIKPGAVIAFKQLEVSKATNWQPVVSDYRTAVVEQLCDGSTIQLRLAKRDREQRPQNQDPSSRQYSGFEMPGYDEEQGEDDGIRDLDVDQLMEPKLVRPAPTGNSGEIMVEQIQGNDLPEHIPDSIAQGPEGMEMTEISSQTRHDISQLIDDAGFRSAIDSDLNISDRFPTVNNPAKDDLSVQADNDDPVIESPAFSGFDTSPPHEIKQRTSRNTNLGPLNTTKATNNIGVEESTSVPTGSAKNSAQQVNPVIAAPLMPSDDGLHYITDPDNTVSAGDMAHASQISKCKSLSLANIHCSQSQDQETPFQDSQAESLLSTVPPTVQQNDTQNDRPGSAASSTVTNPFFEGDRGLFAETSDVLTPEAMVPSTAPPTVSDSSKFKKPAKSKRKILSSPQQSSPQPQFFYKDDDKDKNYEPQLPKSSKPKGQSKSPQKAKVEPMSSQASIPKSQIPEGSQIVDLTLSSDPILSDSSDGDFAKSLRLPGWVQKRTRRSIRTRSSKSEKDALPSPRRARTRRSVI